MAVRLGHYSGINERLAVMSNEAQARHWNEIAGPVWVQSERVFDRMLEPCQRAVLTALAPRLGETILDVGCGFGTTTIAVGSVLGWNGRVHGVDISRPMIERAITRVAGSPLNLSFGVLDVQTDPLHGPYDAVVSRFGVMFFDNPAAAFVNIAASMRAGGRLAFVCWQELARNQFFQLTGRHLGALLADPPAPLDPHAPSPFAFADPERTRSLLASAGWESIDIQPFEPLLRFDLDGDDGIERAIDFMVASEVGQRARLESSPEVYDLALAAARTELAGYLVDGAVQLPAATWIVSAQVAK
jgi:SAM-dependent methyltransferase